MNIVTQFTQITGLELGLANDKTAWTSTNTRARYTNIKWDNKNIPFLKPDESYKYLGAHINLRFNILDFVNKKLNKYLGMVALICKKRLPISFKTDLINKFALSVINYFLVFIPPQKELFDILEEANKKAIRFLKYSEKLPHSFDMGIFNVPKCQGGFGLINITNQYAKSFITLINDRILNGTPSLALKYVSRVIFNPSSAIAKGCAFATSLFPGLKWLKKDKDNKFYTYGDLNGTLLGHPVPLHYHVANSDHLTIFGDGSVKNEAMSCAIFNPKALPETLGMSYPGINPSSTFAELGAFELMLYNTPDVNITWVQDSLSALKIIDKLLLRVSLLLATSPR